MDIEMHCGCGNTLSVGDVEPATAELMIENFHKLHPHMPDVAMASATTTYVSNYIAGPEETEGETPE